MCGLTRKPFATAFFASRPAASSTLGLEVLVQEVIAAISTSPWPIPTTVFVSSALWLCCAGVGWLSIISISLAALLLWLPTAGLPAGALLLSVRPPPVIGMH